MNKILLLFYNKKNILKNIKNKNLQKFHFITPLQNFQKSFLIKKISTKINLGNGEFIEDVGNYIRSNETPGINQSDDPFEPIKLISAVPPIEIHDHQAICSGSSIGHPIVYIEMKNGEGVCGYCGLRFIQKKNKNHSH
jgi:uncharacterized Zn-finger protein